MERKSNSTVAHGSNGATFEQQFARLQEVVQRLSDGNLTLQEALSAFEEGMLLADNCGQMLEEAELRVQQVSERGSRAGALQALELEMTSRIDPQEQMSAQGEVLVFEVETHETTLVFDPPQSIRKTPEPTPKPNTSDTGKTGLPQYYPLDPLFGDEED